jgi:hexulose-6-phosphate isomerase
MRQPNGTIGFLQGRLCDQVDGKIQAFPWRDWKAEFVEAQKINLSCMEWTIDQENLYENPLMSTEGREKINSLCEKYQISIPSLTGDCFMQAPFWKSAGADEINLKKDFLAVCDACSAIRIKMIVVPLVDNGRLESLDQENKLIDYLLSITNFIRERNLKIIFESDYDPNGLSSFIEKLPSDCFGINYDIGDSAALGFDPVEQFSTYGSRIMNVHVKDRRLGGKTIALGSGDADFETVFSQLKKINYQGNYILQPARAVDRDHAGALSRYRKMVEAWIS